MLLCVMFVVRDDTCISLLKNRINIFGRKALLFLCGAPGRDQVDQHSFHIICLNKIVQHLLSVFKCNI